MLKGTKKWLPIARNMAAAADMRLEVFVRIEQDIHNTGSKFWREQAIRRAFPSEQLHFAPLPRELFAHGQCNLPLNITEFLDDGPKTEVTNAYIMMPVPFHEIGHAIVQGRENYPGCVDWRPHPPGFDAQVTYASQQGLKVGVTSPSSTFDTRVLEICTWFVQYHLKSQSSVLNDLFYVTEPVFDVGGFYNDFKYIEPYYKQELEARADRYLRRFNELQASTTL